MDFSGQSVPQGYQPTTFHLTHPEIPIQAATARWWSQSSPLYLSPHSISSWGISIISCHILCSKWPFWNPWHEMWVHSHNRDMEERSMSIWHCHCGYWPCHLCRYGWSWCCLSIALFLIFCWWYPISICTHLLVHMWWARWNHSNVDCPTWWCSLWCSNCSSHSSWHDFMCCSPSSCFQQRLSAEAAQTWAHLTYLPLSMSTSMQIITPLRLPSNNL